MKILCILLFFSIIPLAQLFNIEVLTDEKPKIQHFLTFLPPVLKERIEYENPKTLEEVMQKENFCFDQNKNKRESTPTWKNQRPDNFDSK